MFKIQMTRNANPNPRGNTVAERFVGVQVEDRYAFDYQLCSGEDGWRQYDTDQDASYFGVWVHLGAREIVTYAEGDLTLVTCADDAHLTAELDNMGKAYGAPPAAATALGLDGSRTEYFDTRPHVGMDESAPLAIARALAAS